MVNSGASEWSQSLLRGVAFHRAARFFWQHEKAYLKTFFYAVAREEPLVSVPPLLTALSLVLPGANPAQKLRVAESARACSYYSS